LGCGSGCDGRGRALENNSHGSVGGELEGSVGHIEKFGRDIAFPKRSDAFVGEDLARCCNESVVGGVGRG
jgi:hypothetical protein